MSRKRGSQPLAGRHGMNLLASSLINLSRALAALALLFQMPLAGLALAQAQGEDPAQIVFSLELVERAGQGSSTGKARVVFNALAGAGNRMVQGWSYRVYAAGVEILDPVRGASLSRLCSEAGSIRCEVRPDAGGVTVDVLLTEDPRRGVPERAFSGWEDLVLTYRCARLSCDYAGLSLFPRQVADNDLYSTLVIEGEDRHPSDGGQQRVLLCNIAESLSVAPLLKRNGDVGIYFFSPPGLPSCLLTGWTYGVCIEGDIELVQFREPAAYTGEDTWKARNGNPPAFNFAEYIPGQGVKRSVVLDYMKPIAVDASSFGDGFEDLVISFARHPCGSARICHQEVGDPAIVAVWNNVKEDSLDIVSESLGRLDLCWNRGDTNFDRRRNVADAVNLLLCIFSLPQGIYCDCVTDKDRLCAAVFNVDGDDRWNVADAVYLLSAIFLQGPPVPPLR